MPAALQAVRPTTIPAVPRVFEKVHASVRAAFEARAGVGRTLAEHAVSVGRARAARLERGDRIPLPLALQVWFADRLVFAQVRKRLGGRFRIGISGGAPLGREVAEFFAACGVPILEGYGLSETTSGCCVNRPDRYRFGTVGLPLPGVELALAPDGELLIRGATVFQRYHGRPEETAAAFTSDGWLRTGDVGTIDDDGFLSITDRKKELIVTAGGKKIAPAKLEHALKASPYVGQVLIVGDRRPYLVALISPDEEAVARSDGRSAEELVAEAVAAANARLGRTEQIKRFAVLPRPLELARGELTPTLKVKRRVCEQRFSAELDALYDGAAVGAAAP